jgi:uncharacterized protein (DUF1800 family)
MPLPEFSGTLGLKRAAHLLRRATFGATKSQIDAFATLTPAQAIDQLFRQTLPDPALPINPDTGQSWFLTGTTSDDGPLQEYFKAWCIGQMLSMGIAPNLSLAYSAREKVVHFLHTHFTAIQLKIRNSRSLYFQNQLFRIFALDALNTNPWANFKELTVKMSIDDSMLRLLDGWMNFSDGVNENYARELLELYSIGRGLEGTLPPSTEQGDYVVYTEHDVRMAARVLSGWNFDEEFTTIDTDTGLRRGRIRGTTTSATAHDNEPKVFSTRLGGTVTPDPTLLNGGNATEASALDEIRQLIDIIYNKQDGAGNSYAAKNICWKIYRFFVYGPHAPTAIKSIDENIINNMAQTFVANNYKIQPVIENLLRSQHFYEASSGVTDDNFGAIIKSPLDLAIGTLRFFNVQLPDIITSAVDFYELAEELLGKLATQGMKFYDPLDVSGYDAYAQYPIYHRSWITPNYLATRYDFMRSLISSTSGGRIKADVLTFVQNNISNAIAADAQNLIIEIAKYIYPVTDNIDYDDTNDNASPPGITVARLNYFKSILLGGFEDSYWPTIWNGTSVEDKRIALEKLFNAMLQSPEYQLA